MSEKSSDGEDHRSTLSSHVEKTPEQEKTQPPAPPYSAFSPRERKLIVAIVAAAGFLGPLSGAIYLPALPLFEKIFSASATAINATVSVFMVFFAIGPLLWAASADYGGRRPVYLVSLGIFIIANVLLAALPLSLGALFVLRILQALGSCGVTAVGAGTVADVIEPRHRASALSVFILGPDVGPILGPLIGGQFAVLSRWRWIFWFLVIACVPVYCLVIFCLPETLRSLVGNGEVHANRGWIRAPHFRQAQVVDSAEYPAMPRPSLRSFYRMSKYPPNLLVMVSSALMFAAFYAVLVTFPRVFKDSYGFTEAQVGYAYLCPGLFLLIGSLASGKTSDHLRKKTVQESGDENVLPERRITSQIYGFILAAAGLCMYGWFCEYKIHPSAVFVSSALGALGLSWTFTTTTSYQTECFPTQAASLVALTGLTRYVAAAISALVIERLTTVMGFGWCFTGLAVLMILCIPGVLLITKKGSVFRQAIQEEK